MSRTTARNDVETWLDSLDLADLQARDAELHAGIDAAREARDTWSVIGGALDVTKQAAYQRFARVTHA